MAEPPTEEHPEAQHPFQTEFEPEAFESGLRAIAQRKPFLFPREDVPAHFKHSSVLICFWRDEDEIRVLLTKRAASLRGHPGQMSFPGGRLEAGENWEMAALRETEEEVGLPRGQAEVLGRLDDAWSGAGHLLVPIIGWLPGAPSLRANPGEVESIHTPGVSEFFLPTAHSLKSHVLRGMRYYSPTLQFRGAEVYGLSADLLIEAVQYALGFTSPHGPGRLDNLRSYYPDDRTSS